MLAAHLVYCRRQDGVRRSAPHPVDRQASCGHGGFVYGGGIAWSLLADGLVRIRRTQEACLSGLPARSNGSTARRVTGSSPARAALTSSSRGWRDPCRGGLRAAAGALAESPSATISSTERTDSPSATIRWASRSIAAAFVRPLVKDSQVGLAFGFVETASTTAIVLAPIVAGFLYDKHPLNVFRVSLGILIAVLVLTVLAMNFRGAVMKRLSTLTRK